MIKRKNKTNKKTKIKKDIIFLLGIITYYIIISYVICMVLYFFNINVYNNYIIIFISFSALFFFTGYISGLRKKKRGMLYGLFFNIFPVLLFTVLSLVLNSFSYDYRLILFILSYIFMSSAGGIVSVNFSTQNIRRK